MWLQEFVRYEFLEVIAEIIGFILGLFKPYVIPIGDWMVGWVTFLLNFFPTDSLMIYYIIFGVLVISGIIINLKWPGEKLITVYRSEDEKDSDKPKSSIEHLSNE
jgi:hypothetical protein